MYYECKDCDMFFYDEDEHLEECPYCGGSNLKTVDADDPFDDAIDAALDEMR